MQAFTVHEGLVAPLHRNNVDTDAIIPKQYLKSIRKSGFGSYLFDDWRYLDPGSLDVDIASRRENPEFILNRAPFREASILLAGDNFGCGSSREHAVWALENFGFRCVIAPAFADIFYNNCFKNGVLPVRLKADEVEQLFAAADTPEGIRLQVDLNEQTVSAPGEKQYGFEVEGYRRKNLLEGLDDIGQTLQHADLIREYEQQRKAEKPWLFREL